MSMMITRWREMFDDFTGSLKRVGETSPIENPIPNIIEDVEDRIENIDKTVNKYFTFVLIGLGLIAAIVVVDTVGDVLD